jgi:predicted enzyme related to lactoylglutathione lyase
MHITPGTVLWTELMTPDPTAAAAFYTCTAGWSFDQVDMGMGPYYVARTGETMVAGITGMLRVWKPPRPTGSAISGWRTWMP